MISIQKAAKKIKEYQQLLKTLQTLENQNKDYENQCRRELRVVFTRIERDILKAIHTYEYLPLMMYDYPGEIISKHWFEYKVILLYYVSQAAANRLQSNKLILDNCLNHRKKDYAVKNVIFDLFKIDPKVSDLIENTVFRASEITRKRVDKTINNVLRQSYQDGWGINSASKDIKKKFSQIKTYEATRIARTEINSACNLATFNDSYLNDNLEYYQWWTARDERVRGTHRTLHGVIVRKGDPFPNNLTYPGDKNGPISEWINCRCTLIPYVIPPGYIAPTGMTSFRKEDLIKIPETHNPTYTNSEIQEGKTTIDYGVNIKDYDKYALTDDEVKSLNKLETDHDTFLKRKKYNDLLNKQEFNQLHKKLLTEGKLTDPLDLKKYTHLLYKFDKAKANTGEERTQSIQYLLNDKEREKLGKLKLKGKLSKEETKELKELEGKQKLQKLHKKVQDYQLTKEEAKQYNKLYDKFKKQYNLPPKHKIEVKGKIIKRRYKLKTYNDYSQVPEKGLRLNAKTQKPNAIEQNIFQDKWSRNGYKAINAYNRGQEITPKILKDSEFKSINAVKEADSIMENFIKKNKGLKENTILWRGEEEPGISNLKVGKTYTWKSYSSTSFDGNISKERYANISNVNEIKPILYMIHAKKGTKGAALDEKLHHDPKADWEFLLNKNQKFKVLEITDKGAYDLIDIMLM